MDLGARSSSPIYVKINKFLQKKRRRPSKITLQKRPKSTSVALDRNFKHVEKGSMVHLDMNFPSSTLGRRVSLDEWMFVQPLQDLMFFGRECFKHASIWKNVGKWMDVPSGNDCYSSLLKMAIEIVD